MLPLREDARDEGITRNEVRNIGTHGFDNATGVPQEDKTISGWRQGSETKGDAQVMVIDATCLDTDGDLA